MALIGQLLLLDIRNNRHGLAEMNLFGYFANWTAVVVAHKKQLAWSCCHASILFLQREIKGCKVCILQLAGQENINLCSKCLLFNVPVLQTKL